MPRSARARTKSGMHHILVQGPDGAQIFHETEQKMQYLSIIQKYHADGCIRLYAWCILDNSAHFVFEEQNDSVSEFMRRTGISFVHWYNKNYRKKGPLFRDRYASEVISGREELVRMVRYLHQLPVRYGESDTMEDYLWSSYRTYLTRGWQVDSEDIFAVLQEDRYVSFMEESWKDSFLAEKTARYRIGRDLNFE